MTDFDYAPIASPDEEELQKLQLSPYPAIGSPGPALLTLPAAGAPSVRDTSLTAPASKPLSYSGTNELAIAPRSSSLGAEEGPLTLAPPNPRPTTRNFGPRPSAVPTKSEYAAVEPHGWKKALAIIGPALMAAGGNTRGAESMSEQLFEAPKERLEAQKQGAARDYDTAYREALETEKEQEAERKDAAAGAGAAATVTTDKGVMQWNPATQRYDISAGGAPAKAGTPADQVIHDLMTGNNGQPRINPQTQQPYSYLEAFNATEKPTAPNQEANKRAFQDVVAKLDAAHLATDPKHLDASLDAALMRGVISQQEHGLARGYQSANPTPGTNLTVRIAGQEAVQAMKNAHSYYLYDGKLVSGDKVPADADAVPVKDPQQFRAGALAANTVANSFNHVADANLKIFDDPRARAVLATALDDGQARNIGLLVAGTGGSISLPSGTGKIIDQLLENHAVPVNLQREVKNYITDYWAMKDKLLVVQMQMQQGKIGRGNQAFFAAMLSQLPGPGTADSIMARRQLRDFSETLNTLKSQYGDLADVNIRRVEGDVGEPKTGGAGTKLSPAGQQYLNSILGH